MRRLLAFMFVCVPLLLSAAPASAATTSVNGSGNLDRLVLANQQDGVLIRLFAPGVPTGDCNWSVYATFRDLDGTRYTITRACYGESTRATTLERGGFGSGNIVACAGDSGGYNSTQGFWKLFVPRSCLSGLGNQVRVNYAQVDNNSPSVNTAGPTSYVARG